MRKKRILGLALLGLVALGLTGCSKHARLFWSGAAVGAIAATAIATDCEPHHYHGCCCD